MVLCRFYLQGRCDRGLRCAFDHPQPANEGLSALRAGATPFIPSSDSFTLAGNSPSILFAQPCRFFAKGFCAKGETCSYRHVVSAPLSEQGLAAERVAVNQPDPFSNSPTQPSLTTGVTASQEPVAEESTTHGSITPPVGLSNPFAYSSGN
jgi:Zinc finger C-x8-C-x5-C-x3-H type (and similar)/RNA-binding, Nab2-type zinc finger